MPKIVSNTTPILALLKVNQLDLLRQIYGSIYIPGAVFKEIEKGVAKDYYIDLTSLSWIRIEPIKDEMAKQYFTDLDEGEAETIMLASELNADLVLLDELLARRQAKKSGLTVTGTIGVLIKAKELKLINEVIPILLDMKEKGIWLHSKLLEAVKIRINE